MPKRKPDTDHPEHHERHTFKKAKKNEVKSADTAVASAGYSLPEKADQRSIEQGSSETPKTRKRALKAARRKHRGKDPGSQTASQRNAKVNGDVSSSEHLLKAQEAQRPKRQQSKGQQHPQQMNTIPETAQQKGHGHNPDDTQPKQPIKALKEKQPKKRRQASQEHRPSKSGPQISEANEQRKKDEVVQQSHSLPSWIVSDATGGQMLDHDPLFSTNEEYLLIAHQSSVNVYATATSILVRELRLDGSERLSAFAFSCSDPSCLYAATRSGAIQAWNWLEGRKIRSWHTKCPIYALAVSKVGSEDESDLVYSINRKEARPWIISAHRLEPSRDADENDLVTLRTSREPITSFKVVNDGKLIVATSGSVLTLGTTQQIGQSSLSDLSYTWRDVECPEWISYLDVRTVEPEDTSKDTGSKTDEHIPRTDIVIGGLRGSIHVYDDLLTQLISGEKKSGKGSPVNLTSRTKHWHRNAVLSVKWSRDGNYILSGGLETVLLIWQLETGNLDTLPHLGAPLDGIVVSPSGSGYAIRLADNSAMILSTAELKPTFSVAGLQLPAGRSTRTQLPFLTNVDAPKASSIPSQRLSYPVATGPTGLLCAVPSATSSRIPTALPQHASYLQTFDVSSAHQISRQALTRTKATDLTVGPESNTIEEPDIVLMQISHDGQWLATVDEWMPPKRDMAPITHDDVQAIEEQTSRRETYLKFWAWNNDSKVWALVSRIDNPHALQTGLADEKSRVLDLAADPLSNTFATIGQDGAIRIWSSSTRQRHGLDVKDRKGQGLTSWKCRSTIALESGALSPQTFTEAKLAYSQDGSCLAAACVSPRPWTICLVDPMSGSVRTGPYGPFTGSLSGLGILDKYLILLSEQLCVWNLVTQELVYGFQLAPPKLQVESNRMAVDFQGATFAVVLSEAAGMISKKGSNNVRSKILIFEPADPMPIFVQKLPQPATALTTLYNRPGYLVVNSAAEIRTLTPRHARLDLTTALPSPPPTPSRGLQEIYGDPKTHVDLHVEEARKQMAASIPAAGVGPRVDDEGANVVPQEKLAEVFNVGPAYAMPPITDLFERVARLFAGKTGV